MIGDITNQNRYNAACACVLAAAGRGEDTAFQTEPDKTRVRERARAYLEADLANWMESIRGGSQQSAAAARRTLQHWKVDSDLASVREADSLERMPEAQRKPWHALWDNVAAALKQPGL